jgi:hypothetical protein
MGQLPVLKVNPLPWAGDVAILRLKTVGELIQAVVIVSGKFQMVQETNHTESSCLVLHFEKQR